MKVSKLISDLEKIRKHRGDLDIKISIDEEGNEYKDIEDIEFINDMDNMTNELTRKKIIVIWPRG